MGGQAIIIVDHGSRAAAANEQLDEIAERLRARLPEAQVEAAHMELAQPDLPTAIDQCVTRGASTITIALWFLAPGRHGAGDIPRIASEARTRHPGIEIVTTEPLGVHDGLVDALTDRINESASRSRKA